MTKLQDDLFDTWIRELDDRGEVVMTATLSMGMARLILLFAQEWVDLEKQSKVNRAITKATVHDLFLKLVPREAEENRPIHILWAKNIVKEFGREYRQSHPVLPE